MVTRLRSLTTPFLAVWRTRGAALLAILALALPATARWWWRGDLPAGADTAIHLFRAVQLDWAVRHGYLYPRWSPDMVFGFGYPLFLVHGPVAQYVIVALHALGLSFIAATLAAFALADLLGALGVFALVRRLGRSDLAGVAAAAAYVYAPYVLGSLYRGSPAEALALGLLPWCVWAFLRLLAAPSLGRLVGAGALYALLPLLHNPSTVLGSLALGAVVLLAALGRGGRWRALLVRLAPPALAVGLGLVLSAFYWLPVVAEVGAIQIERAYATGVLDYHNNFLSMRELFAAPAAFDPQLIGWSAPRSYGWPALLLALAAVVQWPWLARAQRLTLLLAVGGAAAAGALTLPGAVWAWEHVPGLSLVQFPARLLGPGSLALAVAAGLAFANLAAARRTAALLGVAGLACGLFGLAWTFQYGDPLTPANPTLADLHAFEQRTGAIGTTTAGEYLPVGVRTVPPPVTLAERYAAGAPILRLDPASLPAGAAVLAQSAGLITQSVSLDTPVGFDAVFEVFNFPGWQAQVDGLLVPITTTDPYGLIAVPVPAGAHTVAIAFGTTPARQAGSVVSALGLFVGAALVVTAQRRKTIRPALAPVPPLGRAAWPVVGVSVALLVFRVGVAGRVPTPYAATHFDGVAVDNAQHPLDLAFSDQMVLLGYDQERASVPSGGAVAVTLYWRVAQLLAVDYSTTLALVDDEGHVYAQADSQHPAGFPTSRWRADQYGRDVHPLMLLPGTPPGEYRLIANVYRYPELTALTAGAEIGQLTVTRPARPAVLTPPQPVVGELFGGVDLLGVGLVHTEIGVGDDVPLDLYWASGCPCISSWLEISLWAADDTQVALFQTPLLATGYDTDDWRPGDQWLGRRSFRVPADLASGEYTLRLRLNSPMPNPLKPHAVGVIHVTAPERVYAAPTLAHTESARFGEVAELVGWEWQDQTLTLVWRALGTADRSYSVFVHARDAAGAIYSQRDTPPANGARPTTSWLAGEIIVDTYQLDVPPGDLTLAVGLYAPQTGARLMTIDGADLLVLRP